jgi:purine-binding chemotaxis protein CheW
MTTAVEARPVCTFRLAGRTYGVPVVAVKEVNAETRFTRVPQAPPAVAGYANLRGQLYLVVDVRQLLDLPPAAVGPDTRLVLFKPAVGEAFGLVVDAVGDIRTLPADAVEEWHGAGPAGVAGGGELIAGVGKVDEGLILLLDPARVLPAVARRLAAAAG